MDFVDTFSAVAKMVTVKVLLALAASQKWFLHQLDVTNMFLNGDLFEEVYMDLPLGYKIQGSVLMVNRSMLVITCTSQFMISNKPQDSGTQSFLILSYNLDLLSLNLIIPCDVALI